MKQVTIIKNWSWPDLRRQTPNGDGVWGGISFSMNADSVCDAVVVLNNCLEKPVSANVRGQNVWALMQEPYAKGVTDWMVEKHAVFDKVFSHHLPCSTDKYIRSHPAIPWHVDMSYTDLMDLPVVKKERSLSWIVGNISDLPGHLRRRRLLEEIRRDPTFDIDLYGRAVRFIESKNEGLLPYRYSLAIENTSSPDYWTEKIADCLLTWTVPIYYGCPNLENYFPPEAFIRIDVEKPDQALAQIRQVVANDDWETRLPALTEARNRILNRYQLFPHLCALMNDHADSGTVERKITIPAYRRSPRAYIHRRLYKFRKGIGLL